MVPRPDDVERWGPRTTELSIWSKYVGGLLDFSAASAKLPRVRLRSPTQRYWGWKPLATWRPLRWLGLSLQDATIGSPAMIKPTRCPWFQTRSCMLNRPTSLPRLSSPYHSKPFRS